MSCRGDLLSCKKTLTSNAKLIGYDYRECACCGGIEVTIDSITNKPFYLIEELPTNFNLGTNPKFPIPIILDWKIDSTHCNGNFIKVISIKKA